MTSWGSYFPAPLCESWPQRCESQKVWVSGGASSNKTIIVLNEVSLLSLDEKQINKGDLVLIIAATPKTFPNGLVVVVNPADAGTWLAFAVVPSGQLDFSTLPTSDPGIQFAPWNNGGVFCISSGPTLAAAGGPKIGIDLSTLPTSDPHVLYSPWNNNGVLCISNG